jgi:hypothetical protein
MKYKKKKSLVERKMESCKNPVCVARRKAEHEIGKELLSAMNKMHRLSVALFAPIAHKPGESPSCSFTCPRCRIGYFLNEIKGMMTESEGTGK